MIIYTNMNRTIVHCLKIPAIAQDCLRKIDILLHISILVVVFFIVLKK